MDFPNCCWRFTLWLHFCALVIMSNLLCHDTLTVIKLIVIMMVICYSAPLLSLSGWSSPRTRGKQEVEGDKKSEDQREMQAVSPTHVAANTKCAWINSPCSLFNNQLNLNSPCSLFNNNWIWTCPAHRLIIKVTIVLVIVKTGACVHRLGEVWLLFRSACLV